MLDYKILQYEVEYIPNDATKSHHYFFHTEEDAVEFIKRRRENWKYYRLIQYQTAIIDF